MAAAHGRLRTVGVTGTNGKTTTTSMIAAIVAASGEPAARVTTLGAWVGDERVTGTDLVDEFLVTVERAVACGVTTIAVEMTSKALAAGVARKWRPEVGVVTNVTRDHLDVHGTPEAYLAAKAQIVIALAPGGTAVLNGDDPAVALLGELVPEGVAVRRFSLRDQRCEMMVDRVDVSPTGTRLAVAGQGTIELGVIGAVHAQNAMAAALAAQALGYSADAIRRGLAAFVGVPGRFEVISRDPLVIVDYAHTPDGLVGTLATARAIASRVICVFGCGGNRDRGKRPEMGAVADGAADVVVLTTDNPRREDPQTIAAEIRAGVPNPRAQWIVELDRARAVELAVAMARPTDIIVIAGKGHEQVQELLGATLPFADAAVARAAICRRDDSRLTLGRIDRLFAVSVAYAVAGDDLLAVVTAARSGDRIAFAELYRRFHRAVHGVVLARVAFAEASDLVQDVFAIALERLPDLAEPSAFASWILTIARHHAIDHARVVRPIDELVDVPAPITRSAEVAQVLAALRALPEAYRETLILRLVEGLTGPEIAEQIGLSAGSVRVNLHRGMKLLRERLGMKERPDGG